MSYILDALRKAESERRIGSVPGIYGAPPLPAARPVVAAWWRRPVLGWALAGALLCTAALLVWRPWESARSPTATAATAVRPDSTPPSGYPAAAVATTAAANPPVTPVSPAATVVAAQPKTPVAAEPEPTQALPSRAPSIPERTSAAKNAPADGTAPSRSESSAEKAAPLKQPQRMAAAKPSTAQPTPEVKKGAAPASESRPPAKTQSRTAIASAPGQDLPVAASSKPQSAPAGVSAKGAVAAPAIVALRELPDHIRREIPPVAVGGYIYSGNPAERSMLINNRLLREGDQVAPGLILETMMAKEAVLNFRGQRYRMPY